MLQCEGTGSSKALALQFILCRQKKTGLMINTVSYLDSNKALKETCYCLFCILKQADMQIDSIYLSPRRNFSLQENKTKQKNSPRHIIIVSNSLVLIGFNR